MKRSLFAVPLVFAALIMCRASVALGQGSGANQCVSTSRDQDNNIIFKNTCSQKITIVIVSSKAAYLPALLSQGEYQTHSQNYGPYQYFACEGGYIPRDPNGGYPKYGSAGYECRAN